MLRATGLKKIKASSMLCLIVMLSGLFFLPDNVNGLEQCRNDSDCSDKNVYCLDGYCDGHCVPCQLLNREESASGCAKKRENCGPCVPGTEAEDWTGGRKSDYCKAIAGESVNSSYATSESFADWKYLVISAVCGFIGIAAILAVSIHSGRIHLPTALALNKSNKVVESVEYNNNPPPYNPTHPDMHGSTETANNSDADSPSNQLLPPAPENVGTELVASVSSEIGLEPGKGRYSYSSIVIDLEDKNQEANVRCSLFCMPVERH